MTEEQKTNLLKDVVGAIDEIKAQVADGVIKDYEIPPIRNFLIKKDIGMAVILQLNTRFNYNSEVLTMWKDMLKADGWSISVKRNQLRVIYKVRYKEGSDDDKI